MYSLNFAVGDYLDERVYHNDSLRYLPDLNDPGSLELLNRNRIVIACGQERWGSRLALVAKVDRPSPQSKRCLISASCCSVARSRSCTPWPPMLLKSGLSPPRP